MTKKAKQLLLLGNTFEIALSCRWSPETGPGQGSGGPPAWDRVNHAGCGQRPIIVIMLPSTRPAEGWPGPEAPYH